MAGFKRTLTVGYGMTQVVCDLLATKVSGGTDGAFVQLCTNGGQHDPKKPNWDPECSVCGRVGRDTLVKGSEVAQDQYVVFTADEVREMRAADSDPYKGQLILTAHATTDVGSKVMPSGTTYMLVPSENKKVARGDQGAFYAMLREALSDPDVTYLGRYTVTSKASLYRVHVYNGVITAEQMLETNEVVEMPTLELPPVPEQMLEMIHQTTKLMVQPFDPATYANAYAQRVAAAVAERESVDASGAPLTTPVVSTQASADPFAAMQAQMAAFLAASGGGNGSPADAVADQDAKPAPKKRASKPKAKADAA